MKRKRKKEVELYVPKGYTFEELYDGDDTGYGFEDESPAKQAGQFIKGLCGYAFDGVPMETKDAKIASAYAYAKTALDVSVKSRENGRKGGLLVAERMRGAKASPVKPSAAESDPMGMLLKGIVLSVAEDAAESKGKK